MDIAKLGLEIDASGAVRARGELDKLTDAGKRAEGMATQLRSKWGALAAGLSVGLIGKKVLDETRAAQYAMAQLEAAVNSTGGAAGLTVRQLDDMSLALQRTTRYSDEAAKGAQALLLTFKDIKGDTFRQATAAVTDLAQRMGGDLRGAALQVGKALQDPVTGMLALRRSGVSFSESQREVIKQLAETGRLAEAQTLILRELQTEFGGAAEAARNTLGGALEGLGNAWGDLFEVSRESSGGIVEAINGMAAALPKVRDVFNAFFGGISLLAVDAAAGIFTAIEKVKKVFAEFVATMGAGLALFGPTRGLGVSMMQWANGVTASADMTIGALQAWKAEQYALIAAVEQTEPALKASAYATGLSGDAARQAEKDAKDLAKAQAELAKASAEAAEREMELHWAVVETTRAFKERMGFGDPAEMIQRGISGPVATASTPRPIEQQPDEVAKLWENALRSIQESFGRTFERIVHDGLGSFRDLAQSVFDIMAGLAAQIAAALTAEKLGITKILDNLGKPGTAWNAGLGRGQKLGLSGLAGFGIGYGIGGATGSTAGGVLGGAAGGALAGFQMGGPIGAVVGGLAGAVGGLLGAGKAQREAAERLKQAAESMRTSVQAYQQAAAGNQNPFMQEWLQNLARAAELTKQANESLAGKKGESERNKALGEIAVARAQAIDRIKLDFADSIQKQLNALNGPAGEYANQLKEIEKAYEDNKRTALAILGPLADLSQIEELRRRQLEQLAAAEAELHRTRAEDLEVRRLVALGMADEAELRRREIAERRELLKAQQDGWTEQEIAELRYIQGLEREAAAKEAATRAAEDFAERYLRLTNNTAAADRLALDARQADERAAMAGAPAGVQAQLAVLQQVEQADLAARQAAEAQIAAIDAQTRAQVEGIDRQVQATQDGIDAARDNARLIADRMESTRRAVEALSQFRDGLRVGALSPLSPEAQLAESRRMADVAFQQAQGGDARAAAAFPALARDLLEKSRAFNASSTAYVQDFARVEQMATALESQFGAQLTVEERQLAEAEKQTTALEAQLVTLRAQKDAAEASAAEMIARLRSQEGIAQATQDRIVAAIEAQRTAALQPAEALLTRLDQLRTSQEQAIAALAESQFAALLENRNAVATAAQAQIEAVRAGASLQEQAQLQQIAKLEQQRLEYNANAIRQIQELAAAGGTSQEQLASMELTRQVTDARLREQIAAITGLGGKLDRWTQSAVTINVTVNVGGETTTTSTTTGGGGVIVNAPGSGGRPIPQFAMGGTHGGGLRLVGEEGPELEVTGSARYYSASETRALLRSGDKDEVIAELRKQNAHLERLLALTLESVRQITTRLDAIQKTGEDQAEELMLSRFSA